jgi:hypothetical protein
MCGFINFHSIFGVNLVVHGVQVQCSFVIISSLCVILVEILTKDL